MTKPHRKLWQHNYCPLMRSAPPIHHRKTSGEARFYNSPPLLSLLRFIGSFFLFPCRYLWHDANRFTAFTFSTFCQPDLAFWGGITQVYSHQHCAQSSNWRWRGLEKCRKRPICKQSILSLPACAGWRTQSYARDYCLPLLLIRRQINCWRTATLKACLFLPSLYAVSTCPTNGRTRGATKYCTYIPTDRPSDVQYLPTYLRASERASGGQALNWPKKHS